MSSQDQHPCPGHRTCPFCFAATRVCLTHIRHVRNLLMKNYRHLSLTYRNLPRDIRTSSQLPLVVRQTCAKSFVIDEEANPIPPPVAMIDGITRGLWMGEHWLSEGFVREAAGLVGWLTRDIAMAMTFLGTLEDGVEMHCAVLRVMGEAVEAAAADGGVLNGGEEGGEDCAELGDQAGEVEKSVWGAGGELRAREFGYKKRRRSVKRGVGKGSPLKGG